MGLQLVRYIVERRAASAESFSVDAIPQYTPQHLSSLRRRAKGDASTSDVSITEKLLYVPSIDSVVASVARSPVVRVYDAASLSFLGQLDAGSKGQKGSIEAMTSFEDVRSELVSRSDAKVWYALLLRDIVVPQRASVLGRGEACRSCGRGWAGRVAAWRSP